MEKVITPIVLVNKSRTAKNLESSSSPINLTEQSATSEMEERSPIMAFVLVSFESPYIV
jgi:hypothetical protein